MSIILSMDTATKACTVALWKDDRSISHRDVLEEGYAHAEQLHILINEVITEAEISFSDLEAVAVGKGPGSYTGLRIGVSAAKGIAYGLGIPLISIPTLQAMAIKAGEKVKDSEAILRPMLDARRMEVYSASFDLAYNEQVACAAYIIDEQSFKTELESKTIYFFGDGMEKCRKTLSCHKNARFISDIYPSAKVVGGVAQAKFDANELEDVAYFEPFYLKDFLAKPAKKML